jgi:hypothetical protein
MNAQLCPFDPDFCLEDGCGAFGFRRTLVDDLPFMIMSGQHRFLFSLTEKKRVFR